MSQAEELLNSLSGTTYSTEADYVTIGSDRFMVVPDNLKKLGVSADHDVNTIHFIGPRYSENGTDLSQTTIWANYMRSDGYLDAAPCEDVTVDSEDETLMHYYWTISRNVTEAHGNLVVLVCAKSVDSAGNELRHWNSELCHDFYISEGMEVQESVITQYPDLIEYMLLRIATVENKTTKTAIFNYIDQYLDEDPSVIIENIEAIIADQPIQEYVNEYMDGYVDICTTTDRTLENSYAGAYEMVSMEGATEQVTLEGKNLFDINGNVNVRGNDLSPSSYNSVSNGVLTTQAHTASNMPCGQLIQNVNGKSIAVSAKLVSTGTGGLGSLMIYENGNIVKNVATANANSVMEMVYTCTSDNVVLTFGTNGGTGAQFTDIQVEIGTVATDYEPYCGGIASPNPDYPQEIENVAAEVTVKTTNADGTLYSSATIALSDKLRATDRVVKIDGVWYEERKRATVVFDGSDDEVITFHSDINAFKIIVPNKRNNRCNILSNRYIATANKPPTFGQLYGTDTYYGVNSIVFYNPSAFTTVDELRAWLSSNPLIFEYDLAEETLIPIADEYQTVLDNLLTYDGTTHVIVEDTEVQPIVTSKYGTSEMGARAISNTNRIEKLEEEDDSDDDTLTEINAVLEAYLGGE